MDKRHDEFFSTSLIGNQVKNKEGECLGKIEELVIDANTGQVKSVVLELGEAPRFGSGVSAIPWEALKISKPEESPRPDTARTESDSRDHARTGKAGRSSDISVYTYPMSRFR